MHNITRIYRTILRYWIYLALGIVSILGYALFSGVSLMLAIPLLDYVFKTDSAVITITGFEEFHRITAQTIQEIYSGKGLISIFDSSIFTELIADMKDILSRTEPVLLLWIISISLLVIVLLKNLFFLSKRILFANLRGRVIRDIRNDIYRKYLFQSLAFFKRNKIGDSIVRMVSDVEIVNEFFVNSLFNSVQAFVLLIVYARIAVFLNTRLFLISLFLLPVFSIIIHTLGNKIKKYSRRIQEQSSDMFSNIEEKLSGIRIVKSFSREQHEMNRFREINFRHFKYWVKARFYSSFNLPLSELNSTITGLIVLIIGANQVLARNSTFSFGSFITFILAVFSMLYPMKTLTKAYAGIRKALVSLNRISEILNRDSEITQTRDQQTKANFSNDIRFEEVFFSYNGQVNVLKNINFTVKKGEKTALVGSSGSGKTTLVNLLERMYDTTEGRILIDGIPIREIKLQDLRNLFGTVTQESILFADTITANISYGTLKSVSEQDILKAARIANADEFINRLPAKYSTFLNPLGSNLSGGQRQRLCIARAIVGDPPILIFDEATSSLDTESERKVQRAIEKATRNRTVIVIAHRLSTILSADKILLLEQGEIIGSGTHQELLKTSSRYKTLYELQFDGV